MSTKADPHNSDASALPSMDLTTPSGVLSYLSKYTTFVGIHAVKLSGGYTNFVFRVWLQEKTANKRGHDSGEGGGTVIVKHAKGYLASLGEQDMGIDIERQECEVVALRHVRAWLPDDSLVTVPQVYTFDRENGVCVMEDAGEDAVALSVHLTTSSDQKNNIDPTLGETIGRSLGQFLRQLHDFGREDGEHGLKAAVSKNEGARKITVWVAYSRVLSTLTGDEYLPMLGSLMEEEVSKETTEVVKRAVEEKTKKMMESSETVTMGDFWPSNILVQFCEFPDGKKGVKKLYVVDWEEVKPGTALLDDLGQFCGSMVQLMHFPTPSDQVRRASQVLLESFLEGYGAMEERGVRDVLVHAGAYLTSWTPRTAQYKGEEDKVKRVTLEGVSFIVEGSSATDKWSVQKLAERLCSF